MPLIDAHIPAVAGMGYTQNSVMNTIGSYGGRRMSATNEPGLRRVYISEKYGVPAVTIHTGRFTYNKGVPEPIRESVRVIDLLNQGVIDPVFLAANANALRKDQWIELDRVVLKEYRTRLRAWADLMAANSYGGFDAMARLTLEYEAMSDPGSAVVDMDGLSEARNDTPQYLLRSLPLPITHSDFWFSERRLAISGNGGTPFDSTMAEACARRIAEKIERTTIGLDTGIAYGTQSTGLQPHTGNSQVYGYLNYPDRVTKSDFTSPEDNAWSPDVTYNEFLDAIQQMNALGMYGPFRVYHSTNWFKYINRQYSVSGGNHQMQTLRNMLLQIPSIKGVEQLDQLTTGYRLIFVQETSDVARAVNGMSITTMQWPSQGGMRQNFKVMAIQVPQIRSSFSGVCGILDGTVA